MGTYDREAEAEAQANSNKYQCHSNPDHYETERIVCDVCKTVNCKECIDQDWRETGWTVCVLCYSDNKKMVEHLLEHLDSALDDCVSLSRKLREANRMITNIRRQEGLLK